MSDNLPQEQKIEEEHPTSKIKKSFEMFATNYIDRTDVIIYVLVGIFFLVAALIALAYSIWDFSSIFTHEKLTPLNIGQGVIQFISDLLLVLIITEVLGTVTHYLKSRETSLRPFLYIGIISATRSILSISARLSIEGTGIKSSQFNQAMIELGVNAAVILALGITIKLLDKLSHH
jgi:uncharacterized membrane protein (DUF373 family)